MFTVIIQRFPVDPRDFIGATKAGDANTCVADNVVATDPPEKGSLFRWSLGDPFLKSYATILSFFRLIVR
jgi:hypothetical protein